MEEAKYIIITLIALFMISCNSQKRIIEEYSTEWNKQCLEELSNVYPEYSKGYNRFCSDVDRDLVFDLNRKERILSSFNFDKHFNLLMTKLQQTEFDSIIAINIFEHQYHEVEYPNLRMDFIIFKEGQTLIQYETSEYLDEFEISKTEEGMKIYNTKYNQVDGCSCGLKLLTRISSDKAIEKIKLIINPEDNLNFNQ